MAMIKARVPEVLVCGEWIKPTEWEEHDDGYLDWSLDDTLGSVVGRTRIGTFRYVYEDE